MWKLDLNNSIFFSPTFENCEAFEDFHGHWPLAECDISVSKLLGFKTFQIFHWNRIQFDIEKSIRFNIKKFGLRFSIEKNWYRRKNPVSVLFRFWVSSHTGCYTLVHIGPEVDWGHSARMYTYRLVSFAVRGAITIVSANPEFRWQKNLIFF